IEYRIDVNTLTRMRAAPLALNEIGRVTFQARRQLFLDSYERNRSTGSFIIIDPDSNNTVGAGLVIDRMPENQLRSATAAAATGSENIFREEGRVPVEGRERLLGQRAITIWLTGLSSSGKSSIAKETERRLDEAGRHVCVP